MTKEKKTLHTSITPIDTDSIDAVAQFLSVYMNDQFTPAEWRKCLQTSWLNDSPNHGFMMRDSEGSVVGVLCAIYSQQEIRGELKRICNPHSWCVLPEYRTKSIQLVLSVIRQSGFHFTMFSPNSSGLEIFSYLKFKQIDNSVTTVLNTPKLLARSLKFNDKSELVKKLPRYQRKVYQDHIKFPWLESMLFSNGEECSFVLYKSSRFRRFKCANILYISNIKMFNQHLADIRTYLLFNKGFFTTRVETRFLTAEKILLLTQEKGQQKFFLSSELSADDIQNTYSELAAIDL